MSLQSKMKLAVKILQIGFRRPQFVSTRFVSRTLSSEHNYKYLIQEVNQFDHQVPIESASTPPSSWFVSQDFHQLDKKAVFGREWICVGRTDQVDSIGKYFSGILAGEPYLVVRDGSGLNAFYNVCRHHAAQVAPVCGEGCADKFVCPYHGWTYATNGRLTKATRLKGIKDFSAKNFGLIPIQVKEWGPLVFINIGGGNGDKVEEMFDPVKNTIETETGTFKEGMEFVKRVTYDMNCNWKVFVDNYLDGGYHVSVLHKDLTTGLNIDSYVTEVGAYYSLQKVSGADDGQGQNDRLGQRAVYAYLYPNLMINRYGPWMDTNLVIPTGPTTSKVIYDYFLESSKLQELKDKKEDYIKDCLKDSDQVQLEDNFICDSVQLGLQSSAYDVGRYAPAVETADRRFHVLLAQKYKEYLNK